MSDEVDALLSRVRERVTPEADERDALDAALAEVTERAEAAIADLPVDADVLHLGSTARGTWIAGDRDLDVFVRFPTDLDREALESYGLDIGHAVLPDGHEEYAEHPYVVGEVAGFQVDLVPCYDIADATAIRSAVDRTPFHNAYLAERLDDDLADEVRVAKQFLKGIGVYGSDLRTRGFSGFLVELLVLAYDGVRPLVEAAAGEWHPPVEFDPEGHGQATFEDPLVVIDPTDPERNVAAVCSEANVARLQHYARALLADPDGGYFERTEPEPLTAEAVRESIADRGTTPVAVRFDAPDLVDDQLYPQLEKSLGGVTDELARRGFDVLRADSFAADDAVLFLELEIAERPTVERHEGPPVHVREHAENFYRAYVDDPTATGPFVDDARYVVEREREFATAEGFLASDAIFDVALGAHVESALADDYDVLVGAACADLAEAFGVALACFFDPRP